MSIPNFFILGATGYIGGTVLTRFLERSDITSSKITALVRSPEKAAIFASFGINAVIGSHTDGQLVEKLASEADVVVSMADADYLPAIQAILRGLKMRHETTGTVPILIHTSGTGVLGDKALGAYLSDTIYDDANPEQIGSLPVTQPHRTYIILPSTIYGFATTKFAELGIQNNRSIQIPLLVKAALARGEGGTVGAGKNVWNDVHIDDLADLYLVLYDSIKKNPTGTGHGREGYYFGENGTHSLYEVGKAIAMALIELGKGTNPEPTPFTKEETDKYFGEYTSPGFGCNSRAAANRSRSIGWRPKYTTKDLLASIKAEVEASLRGI
ncbi:hypothetical protein C0993_006613 [Termitomyces sp. T159_Od127]|nr:hypothetical protein C0993_006613 [Termitomyces sp. T159_Od127]